MFNASNFGRTERKRPLAGRIYEWGFSSVKAVLVLRRARRSSGTEGAGLCPGENRRTHRKNSFDSQATPPTRRWSNSPHKLSIARNMRCCLPETDQRSLPRSCLICGSGNVRGLSKRDRRHFYPQHDETDGQLQCLQRPTETNHPSADSIVHRDGKEISSSSC